MKPIALILDPTVKSQAMTIDIEPDGNRVTLSLRLDYLDYIKKYVLSITNALTGEDCITNVPVIASVRGIANDLLHPIHYKGIGSLYCDVVVQKPSSEDPQFGNLNEFQLVWRDSYWKN